MASNPLFIIPDFFCIFPMNFAMATLGLKEMGKFLWEGREKVCPVGCLSLVLLNLKNYSMLLKPILYLCIKTLFT